MISEAEFNFTVGLAGFFGFCAGIFIVYLGTRLMVWLEYRHSEKEKSKKEKSKKKERSHKDLRSEILIAADKYAADEKDPNIAIVKTMDFANGAEWAFDLMKEDIVAYKRVCKKLLIDDICSKIREL